MSLGKFCGSIYDLEVLEICLPSPRFIRTVVFPIFHWYSWCLSPSHLLTFCANYGPPTSYENLWRCLETTGTHYNIKENRQTKRTSFPCIFELSVLLRPLVLHVLSTMCRYATSAGGGRFNRTCGDTFCLALNLYNYRYRAEWCTIRRCCRWQLFL